MGLQNEVVKSAEALKAYGKLFAVKGNNISRVNDPEYAKQVTRIQSGGSYAGHEGIETFAVATSDVTDSRNQLLDQEIITEKNNYGTLQGKHDFGTSLEAYFDVDVQSLDKPEDSPFNAGFSKSLNDFFTSFDSLATQPGDPSQKNVVYNNVQTLINQFNRFSQSFQTIDNSITNQANIDLADVNVIIAKIARLNQQISYLELGSTQLNLDDRGSRQSALEDLAKYINFTVADSSVPGSIDLFVTDASNANVNILQYNFIPTTLSFNGTNVVTSASTPDTISLKGGKIAGYLQFKATTLANTQSALDNIANQLVTSVNAIYNPSNSSTNFFLASGTTGATIAFDPSLTPSSIKSTLTSSAGANEVALAISQLSSKQFSTSSSNFIDGTFSQAFAKTVTNLGNSIKINKQDLIAESKLKDSLLSRRESQMSVSLDEEISDIITLQKSYAAIAGFMKILSDLEDLITNKIIH